MAVSVSVTFLLIFRNSYILEHFSVAASWLVVVEYLDPFVFFLVYVWV